MFRIIPAAGVLIVFLFLYKPGTQAATTMETTNELTDREKSGGTLTPEILWKMGRAGASSLSPDGSRIVYAVTYYDLAENRGNSSLYIMNSDGSGTKQVTDAAGNDTQPRWSGDGKTIRFLSDRSGTGQLWSVDPGTGDIAQLSDIDGGIDGFGISPCEGKAFYVKKVAVEHRRSSQIHPDLKHSKALIYDDLMARHWNRWDTGEYSHIFVAPVENGRMTEGADIMPGEPWDAPMAPYFDLSEIAWNNAGTQLAYTCKKLTGAGYSLSTDSDIYLYDLASGETRNLTQGMPGYDKYPVFSPDDGRVAFRSMERAGNESDKDRLLVLDLKSGAKSYLTRDFDYNASNVVWKNDGSVLFISPIEATHQVCRADMEGRVEVVTSGDHDINFFSARGGRAVCEITRLDMATELFGLDLSGGSLAQLSGINAPVYEHIEMGGFEKRWVTTTDGKQMLTWVVFPPAFDPAKKYPVLLYCQGGPQSVVSQFWSYRWNLQLMAAQGYVVVAPNRRGLPSFGQQWLDQISGDYSGQNIRDYLSAIDDVAGEPWADETRMGCVGASYGGYSVFYLAGHHEKRFKAFIAHCGIFNFESMYGETEELWFVNNDYGGSYWDKNPVAQRSYANSPHKFVQKWDTPILIITGQNDYRIPYTQSLQAFTAARVLGIPARLVFFEDEAHQVFKPQNSVAWNREFFAWLDKYVKNP